MLLGWCSLRGATLCSKTPSIAAPGVATVVIRASTAELA